MSTKPVVRRPIDFSSIGGKPVCNSHPIPAAELWLTFVGLNEWEKSAQIQERASGAPSPVSAKIAGGETIH